MAGIKGQYFYDEDGVIIGATGGCLVAWRIKQKYGPDYYRDMGARGGVALNPLKGFGSDRKLASIAGTKGGKISRKRKKTMV